MQMPFTNRRTSTNPRGPQRHRWEPKQPPYYYAFATTVVLLLSIATILALLTVHSVFGGQRAPPITIHPFRGHADPLFFHQEPVADAIVVGSGLAGLTAALTILDRGGTVLIVEKEAHVGGNTNKASSGMNACCSLKNEEETNTRNNNDTMALFYEDTVQSAGDAANTELIDTLVTNSASALTWLRERVGVDMSVLVQLGGHSRKRTHRPSVGFVGAEIINAMETTIRREYEPSGRVSILLETKVSQILHDKNHAHVMGILATQASETSKHKKFRTDHVILATGGFASDRSHGSFLEQYRPELLGMAATAGSFSTGDGISLAQPLGAATLDMEKVQIHPTGFVDPADPESPNKVLAAELLRGVGGILINQTGQRFCNELGTRAYIADKMLEHDPAYAKRRRWDVKAPIPTFHLVLPSSAAREAKEHVHLYLRKGLMTKVQGVDALAEFFGISTTYLTSTIQDYQSAAARGIDDYGKVVLRGVPIEDLEKEVFYVGEVTPVLHYCMGGISIDTDGNVLNSNGNSIAGLHAAGEVTGGVHGNNRLGGNSLLECAVYGSLVGQAIPIHEGGAKENLLLEFPERAFANHVDFGSLRSLSIEELSIHDTPEDCLVGIHGEVYDLTRFAGHHPGGKQSIVSLCGTDGTSIFSSMHSVNILPRVQEHMIGLLLDTTVPPKKEELHEGKYQPISQEELSLHNSPNNCWLSLFGTVYDVTEFSRMHPGGAYIIQKLAGKDGTTNYQLFHPQSKLKMIEGSAVGRLVSNDAVEVRA